MNTSHAFVSLLLFLLFLLSIRKLQKEQAQHRLEMELADQTEMRLRGICNKETARVLSLTAKCDALIGKNADLSTKVFALQTELRRKHRRCRC